jgi:hypothetical protein
MGGRSQGRGLGARVRHGTRCQRRGVRRAVLAARCQRHSVRRVVSAARCQRRGVRDTVLDVWCQTRSVSGAVSKTRCQRHRGRRVVSAARCQTRGVRRASVRRAGVRRAGVRRVGWGGRKTALGGTGDRGRTTRASVCHPPFRERRAPLLLMAPALRRHLRTTRRFRLRASVTVMSGTAGPPFL